MSRHGQCETVEDGQQAVEAFVRALDEARPFDLVCMDIMMPRMDGIDAVKAIREEERKRGVSSKDEVAVLMITALNDPRTVIQAYYQAGATSYLAKPIILADLDNKLAELGLLDQEASD